MGSEPSLLQRAAATRLSRIAINVAAVVIFAGGLFGVYRNVAAEKPQPVHRSSVASPAPAAETPAPPAARPPLTAGGDAGE